MQEPLRGNQQESGNGSSLDLDMDDLDNFELSLPSALPSNNDLMLIDFDEEEEKASTLLEVVENFSLSVPAVSEVLKADRAMYDDEESTELDFLDDLDADLDSGKLLDTNKVQLTEALDLVRKQMILLELDERRSLIAADLPSAEGDLAKVITEAINTYTEFQQEPGYRKAIGTALIQSLNMDNAAAWKIFNEDPFIASRRTNMDRYLKNKAKEVILILCENLKGLSNHDKSRSAEQRYASIRMYRSLYTDLINQSKSLDTALLSDTASEFVSIVKKITLHEQGYSFTCAECSQETKVTDSQSPVRFIIKEDLNDKQGTFSAILLPMRCDCGAINLLSRDQLSLLSTAMDARMINVVQSWLGSDLPVTDLKRVVLWGAPRSLFKEALPTVFEVETTPSIQSGESTVNKELMYHWYLETVETLKAIKASYAPPSNPVDDNNSLSKEEMLQKIFQDSSEITRNFCLQFNTDYESIFREALVSIIDYIKENRALVSEFDYDYIPLQEAVYLMENYLKLGDKSVIDSYAASLQKNIKAPGQDWETDIEKLTRYFSDAKQRHDSLKSRYASEDIVSTLMRCSSVFRFIPLLSKKADFSSEGEFLCNPSLRSCIFLIADQMVLNFLSSKIKVWVLSKAKEKYLTKLGTARVLSERTGTYEKFKEKGRELLSNAIAGSLLSLPSLEETVSPVSLVTLDKATDSDNLFEDLMSAVNNVDYFLFAKSIVSFRDPQVNESLIVSLSGTPYLYKRARAIITANAKGCSDFMDSIEKSGLKGSVAYYVYHYGDQFSVEEIEEEVGENYPMWKASYCLVRNKGEKFRDFLRRSSGTLSRSDSTLPSKNGDSFDSLGSDVIVIAALSLFYSKAVRNYIDNRTNYLTVDLINFLRVTGVQNVYKVLDVTRKPSDGDTMYSKLDKEIEDEETRRQKIVLNNFMYVLFSETSEIDVSREDDGESSVYMQVLANPSILEPYLPLLGEVGDLLDDRFGIRGL